MPKPMRKLDYETIRGLAEIACTDREIAAVLKFSHEWLCRRKKKDAKLLNAIESGREEGKASLRRMQWQKATEGNVTMMIWLGKQILGQRDRMDHAVDMSTSEQSVEQLLDSLPDAVAVLKGVK